MTERTVVLGAPLRHVPAHGQRADNPYSHPTVKAALAQQTIHDHGNPFIDALKRAAQRTPNTATVLYVHPWWHENSGQQQGYELHIPDGNYIVRFKFEDEGASQIAALLHPPLVGKHDRRRGEWSVTWTNEPPVLLSIKEISPMVTPPVETVKEKLDRVAAERSAAEPKHAAWVDDDSARRAFFKLWGNLWGERVAKAGAPADTTKQDEYRKKWLKVHTSYDTLHAWNDSADALLAGLRNALDFDYPIKEAPEAPKSGETTPDAVVVPEAPQAPKNGEIARVETASVAPKVQQEKPSIMTYPESPVVVYPMANGGIQYKGVNFSVTLRLGGTIAMAIPLMDDFIAAWKSGLINIAPACLVREPSAAPMSFQPVPQPVAPVPTTAPQPTAAPAPAPAANGNGGVVMVREIKKFQDEGKTRYELYENPGDQKPALIVRPPAMVKRLLAPHIAVDSLTPGTRYTVNWRCEWKQGGLKENGVDHWQDLSAVTVLAA